MSLIWRVHIPPSPNYQIISERERERERERSSPIMSPILSMKEHVIMPDNMPIFCLDPTPNDMPIFPRRHMLSFCGVALLNFNPIIYGIKSLLVPTFSCDFHFSP